MDDKFIMFMETVDERFRSFVNQINDYLTENGCKCDVKLQKSGYVVSYVLNSSKRTLATYVSRKTGIKLRIYPEHIQEYRSFLDTLPEKVKKEIKKSSVCKRLINPDDCNPKCVKGYTFVLDGEQYQKCRYMAFQPTLSEENNPYIKQFLEKELRAGVNSEKAKYCEKIIERAGKIISDRSGGSQNFCTLAFVDPDGYPHTTTISISKSEGIRWLTFCTGTGAKADIINHCNKASVCINSSEYHIALTGTIEQITAPDVKKEMWYDGLKNHFSGWEDPNYCVLKFSTERYKLFVDWQEASGNLA